MSSHFNLEDASQVLVGAFALAVPISFSEEAWRLGESLPMANLLMLLSLSVIFLSFFAYQSVFQSHIKNRVSIKKFLLHIENFSGTLKRRKSLILKAFFVC